MRVPVMFVTALTIVAAFLHAIVAAGHRGLKDTAFDAIEDINHVSV